MRSSETLVRSGTVKFWKSFIKWADSADWADWDRDQSFKKVLKREKVWKTKTMNHCTELITGPTRRDASVSKKSQNPGRNYSEKRISCSPIAIAAKTTLLSPGDGGFTKTKSNDWCFLLLCTMLYHARDFQRQVLQICNSQKWNQMIDVSCVSRNNTSWRFFRIYVPFNDGSSDIEQNL